MQGREQNAGKNYTVRLLSLGLRSSLAAVSLSAQRNIVHFPLLLSLAEIVVKLHQ
jgi:hypothetical protein